MTSAKKYYWLKLKEDFFDDDTIEWIEEQKPNGPKYVLFYLKLCLKSLKTDGVLIRNVGEMLIPYDVEKLADATNTDIDTVRVAMELFQKIGLIQILENGEIYLAQLKKMVGSESKWAEKKRLQRAKQADAALPGPEEDNVQSMSEESPREIEKEKEKEIDIEKEKELTDKQRERVEFIRDLFVGWSVTDYQIYYLSFLVKERLPFDFSDSELKRDLSLYDAVQKLTMQARADDVKHIYRWAVKVIPYMEF